MPKVDNFRIIWMFAKKKKKPKFYSCKQSRDHNLLVKNVEHNSKCNLVLGCQVQSCPYIGNNYHSYAKCKSVAREKYILAWKQKRHTSTFLKYAIKIAQIKWYLCLNVDAQNV